MTPSRTFGLEALRITKRFGDFVALDDVSLKVAPGTVHALLGENGAGKSTLVKCIMGYYRPDDGQLLVGSREATIAGPRDAHALGLGMVYQHFTLVPSMTVAENLVMARADVPRVVDWRTELKSLERFIGSMPFGVPLQARVHQLSAGERQKCELLKQLYLERHFLILDEPTSVLTPDEADEMLGLLRSMAQRGDLTVLLITHKFREVSRYADDVTVLRKGQLAGAGKVAKVSREDLAAMMVGSRTLPETAARVGTVGSEIVLSLRDLTADDARGGHGLAISDLLVRSHEIVGVAGIAGNGQRELVEVLAGQQARTGGTVLVEGEPYDGDRGTARRLGVRCLPEEPLRNASVRTMSVAENLAFRRFDRTPGDRPAFWLHRAEMARRAQTLIARYNIKTASKDAPLGTLSGGNVQRAVLARELSEDARLLVVANPCFGLDFQATAEIRSQIVEARNRGTAVLLISDDLDEILEIADRIVVISEGRIVHETPVEQADRQAIGAHMVGHH
ncbi:MAG: ABC transporter ATP-binding protein [Proteobacteria bacterium]|nr:ABC transporter ATP-binding protein [Pseudomonadota bacterium]